VARGGGRESGWATCIHMRGPDVEIRWNPGPNLPSSFLLLLPLTHLKSPEPVRANVASLFNLALQTAPLCPLKVPIQSPVFPFRNMGSLS